MKFKKLLLIVAIINVNLFAFKPGIYVCKNPFAGDIVYTLKSNMKYKISIGGVAGERGPWLNHDDAAVLLTNKGEVTIEQKGNRYTLIGYPCKNIKANQLDNYLAQQQQGRTQMRKEASAQKERERIANIPADAKRIANKLNNNGLSIYKFNALAPDLKLAVISELKSMNVFIDGITKRDAQQQKDFNKSESIRKANYIKPIFKLDWEDSIPVIVNKLCKIKGVTELVVGSLSKKISCSDSNLNEKVLNAGLWLMNKHKITNLEGKNYFLGQDDRIDIKAININVIGTPCDIEVQVKMNNDYTSMKYMNKVKPTIFTSTKNGKLSLYSYIHRMDLIPKDRILWKNTYQKLLTKFKNDFKDRGYICTEYRDYICKDEKGFQITLNKKGSLAFYPQYNKSYIYLDSKDAYSKLKSEIINKKESNGLDSI